MKIKELKEILDQYDDEIEVCNDIQNSHYALKINKAIYDPIEKILFLFHFSEGFKSDTIKMRD